MLSFTAIDAFTKFIESEIAVGMSLLKTTKYMLVDDLNPMNHLNESLSHSGIFRVLKILT